MATVITNLVSAVPWIGDATRDLIWGGFSVGDLMRFAPCLISFASIVFIIIEFGEESYRIFSHFRVGPHNNEILEIIFGSLLGDAHAEKRPHENGTRVRFKQSGRHSTYLLWLHKRISDLGYTNSKVPIIKTYLEKGKVQNRVNFSTWSYSSFNWIKDVFYVVVDGKVSKVVPDCIEIYLTPRALAIWIMDDGAKVSSGLKFCTNSFTYEDCLKLSCILSSKFNLKSSIISAGAPLTVNKQYNIYIWKQSMPLLRDIVMPYMESSMKYKII